MAHIIPTGRTGLLRILALTAFFLIFSFSGFGQQPTCTAGSTTPVVHAEGLAELLGSVGLQCTGGVAGSTVSSTVFIQEPVNITNRLDASGNLQNLTISGTVGASVFGSVPTLNSPMTLIISPVQYTVPANPAVPVNITIGGIRGAVATANTGGTGNSFLYGSVVAPAFGIGTGLPLPMAETAPTLLASVLNYGIPCLGSPLPSTVTFPGLIAGGNAVSTIRITEASPAAFAPLVPGTGADFGMRFLVNISDYGPNAQVYVPDVIVGNRGTAPTSAGAYNSSANGGTYTYGSNQLLLSRVNAADATGAGGSLFLSALPGGATSFTSVTQVSLINGAASVTYEVIDANPSLIDSAQIPVFVVVPPSTCSTLQTNTLGVALAPVSNVAVATQTDPIPRYIANTPASDCTFFGDCAAGYFPVLLAAPASIALTGSSQGQTQTAFITVTNGGSSQLTFTASVAYQAATNQSVTNWLSIGATSSVGPLGSTVNGLVDPSAGINSFGLALSASPAALLIPGAYQATVTINAGSAGTIIVPVTFSVSGSGPVIQSVVNAANSQLGPITAGSFAAIYGLNLVPKTTTPATVTFDGFPGVISYDGQPSASASTQINVLVPAALGSAANAGVIATVDGVASTTFPITLVPNAPAVFNPGILNQNNSVNLAPAPASLGDIIQIFLTGLATPVSLPVTVNIGSASITGSQILYAGVVASIPGLEQVNVQVPTTLTFTGNSAPLSICVPAAGGQPTCSAPVNLYLH